MKFHSYQSVHGLNHPWSMIAVIEQTIEATKGIAKPFFTKQNNPMELNKEPMDILKERH